MSTSTVNADLEKWTTLFKRKAEIETELTSDDVSKLRSTITTIYEASNITTADRDVMKAEFGIEIKKLIPTDDEKIKTLAKQISENLQSLDLKINQDWNQYSNKVNAGLQQIENIIKFIIPNMMPL
jgi:uncharacterized protein (DUF927 family)